MHRLIAPLALAACAGSNSPADDDPASDDTEDSEAVDTEDSDDSDGLAETDDTIDTEPPAPACDVGVGVVAFEPFPASGEMAVIKGPQGGWHVHASVICTGIVAGDDDNPLDPNNPRVDWTLEDDNGRFGGYVGLPRPMNHGGGVASLTGEFIIIPTATYEEAIDRDATLKFHLIDVHGIELRVDRAVRLVPYPGYVPPADDTDSAGE